MNKKNAVTVGKIAALLCAALAAAALPAAAAEIFIKRGRVKSEKLCGDVYTLKGKSNSKAVFIANQTPVNILKNVINNHLNG